MKKVDTTRRKSQRKPKRDAVQRTSETGRKPEHRASVRCQCSTLSLLAAMMNSNDSIASKVNTLILAIDGMRLGDRLFQHGLGPRLGRNEVPGRVQQQAAPGEAGPVLDAQRQARARAGGAPAVPRRPLRALGSRQRVEDLQHGLQAPAEAVHRVCPQPG